MKKLITILTILFVLNACKNEEQREQIERIDSLMLVLNDLDRLFAEIDSAQVAETFANYSRSTKEFGKYFTDVRDTNWNTITSYSEIRKPLRNYLRQQRDLNNELQFSRRQLESLKNSIERELIPSDSVEIYVSSELAAISMLEQTLQFLVNDVHVELQRFDSLHPLMLELTETYRQQNPQGLHKNQ